jgi:hypothetical protein
VDLQSDRQHCGDCATVCADGEVCSTGRCTLSCQQGFTNCNGHCADLQSDRQECAGCGRACNGTDICWHGACGTCSHDVLVLGDDNDAEDAALVARLTEAGFNPTLVPNGCITYSGTPPASAYGAVIILTSENFEEDMPADGQRAIMQASASGTGVVLTESAPYHVQNGRWAALAPLLLFTWGNGMNGSLAFEANNASHPVWAGLPARFVTVNDMSANGGGNMISGGQIASNAYGYGAGVAVRGGTGRVVQMSWAANYGQAGVCWTNDPNIIRLMTNSVAWAAKCE